MLKLKVSLVPSLIYVSISALPLIITYFLGRKYKKLLNNLKVIEDSNNYYHQCIFLNMNNFKCREHFAENIECSENCSLTHLNTLINFISSAQVSISLCMYAFTLRQINIELIKAHKRGVHVRIITDQVMLKTDKSQFNFSFLKRNGIPFKVQPSDRSMMHHKFCLIDKDNKNKAKMFFGSLNLTHQGLVANFDSINLTNNWNIIEPFGEEFEELWREF